MLGQLSIRAMISPRNCILLGLMLLGIAVVLLLFLWPRRYRVWCFFKEFFRIERGKAFADKPIDLGEKAIIELAVGFIVLSIGGIVCIMIGLIRML